MKVTITHDLLNKLKNKTMENKSIFKVGDKVYDIRFGWGEVLSITMQETYSVNVDFNGQEETYTPLGRYLVEHIQPLLSFTEYTLQGFSQERSFDPQDCVGKWCMLSDNKIPSTGITIGRVWFANSEYYADSDGCEWDNSKPLTDEQLKAFNLTND